MLDNNYPQEGWDGIKRRRRRRTEEVVIGVPLVFTRGLGNRPAATTKWEEERDGRTPREIQISLRNIDMARGSARGSA